MIKNLEHYILRFPNVISNKICDDTIKELQNFDWKEHKFYNRRTDSFHNQAGEKELETTWEKCGHDIPIMEQVWHSINNYIKEFNFPWHNGWEGYSELRFNRYLPGKLMTEHCDHIHSLFDGKRKGIPTLSILGLLNDDFEGGDFVMFTDQKIEFNKGDLLVFPSNFLYPHRVEEVKSGTRFSFISWSF